MSVNNQKIMEKYLEFLPEITFLGNTMHQYVKSFILLLILLVVLKIFQTSIIHRLQKIAKKTKSDLDDILIEIVAGIKPPLYLIVALFFALNMLHLHPYIAIGVKFLFLFIVLWEIISALEKFADYIVKRYLESGNKNEKASESLISAFRLIVRIVLWVSALLLLLSNMGFNVNSLVASLGVGGIAIALALQNILGDMFSAFSLYLDKPFQIGDFITIGEHSGTIKKIGLKTTRIKTLRGEEIVVSNKELTTIRIQNFKKLTKRRVTFVLGIEYGTTAAKLKKIPALIQTIVESAESTQFERCYFKEYADSSLNFSVSYFVTSSSIAVASVAKEHINMSIYETFEKEGIQFAFPTQTIHVKK